MFGVVTGNKQNGNINSYGRNFKACIYIEDFQHYRYYVAIDIYKQINL
jgi:hypothetical protein